MKMKEGRNRESKIKELNPGESSRMPPAVTIQALDHTRPVPYPRYKSVAMKRWVPAHSFQNTYFCSSGLLFPSLRLIVFTERPWLPVLSKTQQSGEPFQLPRPSQGRRLREWLRGRWAQHLWGQREQERLAVCAAQTRGAAPQQRQPGQPRLQAAPHPAREREDAQRRGLQRRGLPGRGPLCAHVSCWAAPTRGEAGSPAALGEGRVAGAGANGFLFPPVWVLGSLLFKGQGSVKLWTYFVKLFLSDVSTNELKP